MRSPTLFEETLVFVAEDDLWAVSTNGGPARRLTSGRGASSSPHFSPDGSMLAFTGREDGVTEVMVMPSVGGPARRLTWLGTDLDVCGWHEGRVVFSSSAHGPFPRDNMLWTVSVTGVVERMPWGRGVSLAVDGERVAIARHSKDLSWWKGYRGGRAAVIWVRDEGVWTRLPIQSACSPVWREGRLHFISDQSGRGRVGSCAPDGTDLRWESEEGTFYARDLCGHGARLAWVEGSRLMLDGEPVAVELNAPCTWLQPQVVDANTCLEELDLQDDSLLLTVRGKPVQLRAWQGGATRLGEAHGVRHRLARFCGEQVVCVTDEGGEERIALLGGRRFDHDVGRLCELEADPLGRRVAFANHRLQVGLLDLHTGRLTWLATGDTAPASGLTWSADGALLAWSEPTLYFGSCARLMLAELGSGRVEAVTDGRYQDTAPAFDPEGRWLYFISQREFDPVYDAAFFQLGFHLGTRPYALSLRNDIPGPFTGEEVHAGAGLHWEGLSERLTAFPVHESRWTCVLPVTGKLLLGEERVRGGRSADHWSQSGPRTDLTLHAWDLEKRTLTVEHADITEAFARGDTLALRVGPHLRVLRMGEPPTDGSEFGASTGWVDLSRARVPIEPRQERRQMLRETWRMMRDNYWRPDLPKDWQAIWTTYEAELDGLTCRSEYSDLVWRMVGELGTSHAYEMLGDYPRRPPNHAPGQLGAEFGWSEGAWRLTRIVRGEAGDPERSGPLTAPGLNLSVGDALEAVNGVPLSRSLSPEQALAGLAGHEVSLTFEGRTLAVTTMVFDRALNYRDWVCRNRERVLELTGGRAGYLHIPDMGPAGYAEFFRDLKAEADREGILVDVRFNRGGHVSQLLLEKLARTVGSWGIPRHGKPYTWPAHAPLGPLVCLTNEMAGSDGDIFSHGFKQRGMGPLIGHRTWGGVVGIWPKLRHVDGSLTTQPEFASWFVDVGFGIENHGADPDIEVDISPADFAEGRDPQLARAVEVLLERMEAFRLVRPPSSS